MPKTKKARRRMLRRSAQAHRNRNLFPLRRRSKLGPTSYVHRCKCGNIIKDKSLRCVSCQKVHDGANG